MLLIILLIIGIFTLKYLIKHPHFGTFMDTYGQDDSLNIILWVGSILLTIASIMFLLINVLTIVKCLTFQELIIFEYLSRFIESIQ